jgi:hypothetical protein
MNKEAKLVLAGYAVLYAIAALVGFQYGDSVPLATLYVLLAVLFILPMLLVIRNDLSVGLKATLLVVTSLLPALFVVDPLEIGFYGYDPYRTLQTTFEFRERGPLWIANNRASWPAFYAFVWVVKYLLGGEITSFGRFLPLFVLSVPVTLYAFVRKLVDEQSAFLVAMGLVGVRTLFTFEVKFVDESLAFVLFFMLLLSLRLRSSDERRGKYLCYVFAGMTVLTHHYIGFLSILLLVLWDLSDFATLRSALEQQQLPFSGVTILSGGLFAGMFLVAAPEFLLRLISNADFSLSNNTSAPSSPGQGTATSTPSSGSTPTRTPSSETSPSKTDTTPESSDSTPVSNPSNLSGDGSSAIPLVQFFRNRWQFIPTNLLLLSILGAVLVGLRSLSISRDRWQVLASIFGTVIAIGYGISVIFGPIIPLDPSRYLVYMVPMLLTALGISLGRRTSPIRGRQVLTVGVALLAVTQLLLVSPAVLYTDATEPTPDEEHFTASQFAASDWMGSYAGDRIVGSENGVWLKNGIHRLTYGEEYDCEILQSSRPDVDRGQPRPEDEILYDNGVVQLYRCGATN